MKLSLATLALTASFSKVSARMRRLQNLRHLQISESYGFNTWGDEGSSFFDPVQSDTAPGPAPAPAPADDGAGLPNLLEVVAASEDHTTLLAAIESAFLADPLAEATGITLFAPTDEAFAMYPTQVALYTKPEWVIHLTNILAYHVTEGVIMSTDLKEGVYLMGNEENATVTLDPPMINDANIIDADILSSGGVAHVIDHLLLPEWLGYNLLDIVYGFPEIFNVLGSLVNSTGLADALASVGPYTLFAPLDEGISNETLAALSSANLTDILLYHVYPGVLVSDLVDSDEPMAAITMANGKNATLTITEADDVTTYYINGVEILAGDFLVSNGVIHVLAGPLIPGVDTGMGADMDMGEDEDEEATAEAAEEEVEEEEEEEGKDKEKDKSSSSEDVVLECILCD